MWREEPAVRLWWSRCSCPDKLVSIHTGRGRWHTIRVCRRGKCRRFVRRKYNGGHRREYGNGELHRHRIPMSLCNRYFHLFVLLYMFYTFRKLCWRCCSLLLFPVGGCLCSFLKGRKGWRVALWTRRQNWVGLLLSRCSFWLVVLEESTGWRK